MLNIDSQWLQNKAKLLQSANITFLFAQATEA